MFEKIWDQGMAIMARTLWACLLLMVAAGVPASDSFLILQSTTSTQNSGLLDYLLPMYENKTGVKVRVVAVGTGQALRNGRNGDADILMVHSKEDEEMFVEEGFGVKRHDLMYNDYVIVGPANDPARISSSKSVMEALEKIANAKAVFVSRGDDSGTHKKERSLWKLIDVDVDHVSGSWYREVGSGMGATLNVAVAMGAYTLADRGTWISFKNKQDFALLYSGDPPLFNQYGVILVNPEKHPHVKASLGNNFIAWLLGAEGQAAINAFKIQGEQLFYANAE